MVNLGLRLAHIRLFIEEEEKIIVVRPRNARLRNLSHDGAFSLLLNAH